MKRLDYEAPTMELIVVEMEDGFLEASVVTDKKRSTVEATGHEVGETFEDGGISWE